MMFILLLSCCFGSLKPSASAEKSLRSLLQWSHSNLKSAFMHAVTDSDFMRDS